MYAVVLSLNLLSLQYYTLKNFGFIKIKKKKTKIITYPTFATGWVRNKCYYNSSTTTKYCYGNQILFVLLLSLK